MANEVSITGVQQIALTVSDLDRAKEFYESFLGLKMVARFDPPGLMFFYAGDVRLSLQKVDAVEAVSSVIYFRVGDIHAAANVLKRNSVELELDPQLIFPDKEGHFGEAGEEEWMTFFRDPDGHLLALASREKPKK